jgi:hypothetical protein
MELDQWLMAYLAISQSAAAKERSGWSLFVGSLTANSILAIAVVFLISVEPAPVPGPRLFVEIGLILLGLLSSLAWLATGTRVQAEAAHLGNLLRGIEGEFAGSELHRSLFRFSKGEPVCSAASRWTCNEWLPSVSRLPLVARIGPRLLAGLVSLSFLFGWIALLVRAVAL